jgi:MFS family permease
MSSQPRNQRHVASTAGPARRSLLTRGFLGVLLVTFLGFSFEHVMRPVIPLVVIDRGGSAAIVGVMAAIHALPSILFRPAIGALVDGWRHGLLMRLGALAAAIMPFGVLLPGIASLVPVRFAQGGAWAVYSVSAHTLMAKHAPRRQRGEASGYFMAMPALSQLIVPGAAVALYAATGELGPVLLASGLGVAALLVTTRLRFQGGPGEVLHASSVSMPSMGWRSRLLEPSALPATFMITTFMAAHAIFTVFPPVYAIAVGAPIASLVLYYPAYGIVMTASQLLAGRASDRLGRGFAIRIGCAVAIVGLAMAGLGDSMATFTAGAAAYAVGVSLVSPTMSAMTIDRAPANRLGSAMATYSVGYQLATGGSSLVWGVLIAAAGFSGAFVAAIGLQLVTIAASVRFARR